MSHGHISSQNHLFQIITVIPSDWKSSDSDWTKLFAKVISISKQRAKVGVVFLKLNLVGLTCTH